MLRDVVERLAPLHGHELAAFAQQRRAQTLGRILAAQKLVGAVTQEPARDGMVRIAPELDDAAVTHACHDAARIGAIAITQRLCELLVHAEARSSVVPQLSAKSSTTSSWRISASFSVAF